ncbi:conserved hypothetical protein [Anaeromyxobacter dehalogenans 2CP-1]|uniref:Uncharacterized protein n=1 Tax=Anaeromyxobacter dehalogenans (strain ATCC BAA-258 / DSM 21875 / 2CP-1) TaxID=455488 RepID=B8J7Y1_ANAD2|nr:hypothetical protein [Anaeromyxobacter dehalogenans]ACL63473.1 conserved hypothetical protein [Anaeromyxobacter dehalogenans 2CP-1]
MVAARRILALPLAFALAALPAAPGADGPARGATPAPPAAEAEPRAAGPELVRLRWAWPAPLEAQVTCRRTRVRTGAPPSVFTARYRQRAALAGAGEPGLAISTRGTTWEGDLPWAPPVARQALHASEQLVQRIGPDGAFAALEGAEALRPALRSLVDGAGVQGAQAERAVARAEAAARGEAEELWNLSVGFWIDADLVLGQEYVMPSETELPLLPGVRGPASVEFAVRRRVPCAAAERAARCVEIVLHATPEPAALARHAAALRARLAEGAEGPVAVPAAHGRDGGELEAEGTLVLVTDPATLVPRRVAWTRAVRLATGDDGAPALEHVDRVEYDYRYPGKAPAAPPAHRRRRVPGTPLEPAPVPAPVPVQLPAA